MPNMRFSPEIGTPDATYMSENQNVYVRTTHSPIRIRSVGVLADPSEG